MAKEFRLPDIGEGLTEAEIVRWLVAEGDQVVADQSIVELETDKAVVEIPTPYAGTVLQLGGSEGQTLAVGAVLVVIGDADEAAPPSDSDAGAAPSPFAEPAQPAPVETPLGPTLATYEAAPIVGTLNEEAESLTPAQPVEAGSGEQVKALPVVRKLARDHGIDLAGVVGSGPGGRITRQDVERMIQPPAVEASPVPGTATGLVDVVPVAETDSATPEASTVVVGEGRRPLSRMRRTIAANMSRSWAEIPHVTTFDDVDATRLLEVRKALATRHGVSIPIEALVVGAVIPALAAFPEFNATLDGDELVVHGAHHIGIAVDTPEGLMVAVIKDAGSLSTLELAEEVRRLGAGARERTLTPQELTGQTFTVSNIGAVGGGHGTPIVPSGTTGILSVGRARSKPIVVDDDLVIAPVMPLSLSYDHRVVDGAVGRRFMALILENLEEPALFLA